MDGRSAGLTRALLQPLGESLLSVSQTGSLHSLPGAGTTFSRARWWPDGAGGDRAALGSAPGGQAGLTETGEEMLLCS